MKSAMNHLKEVAADCLMKVIVAVVMVVILFLCWNAAHSQPAYPEEGGDGQN